MAGRPEGVDTERIENVSSANAFRYNPDWINASPPVAEVAARLARAGQARLCFAGPSGTGKTAFAKHLARTLDRPLLSKKASDLLGPYLGETEQNLAEAFREARKDGAVLLIDEADSFLQNRQGATRSWEIQQVNEVLKQLEEHNGYVILSTNLFTMLDPAVLRRLDLKVQFGYLRGEHMHEVFTAAAEARGVPASATQDFCRTADFALLKDLGLGDVSAALRQASLLGDTPDAAVLLASMREQVEHRDRLSGRRIGF